MPADVKLPKPLQVDAQINKPVKLEPFPLGQLSDVDLSGLQNGYILQYDTTTDTWKAIAIQWTVPDAPDSTVMIAGDTGVGPLGPGQILNIVGTGGVATTFANRVLTIAFDPDTLDGGSF
jgi:hypothetical protein